MTSRRASGELHLLCVSVKLNTVTVEIITDYSIQLKLFFTVSPCVLIHYIQGVPGGKDNILGGHSIGLSKQKGLHEHVSYSERFPR
jgi:hypothetical protein